jgi:hypothetical protein
MNIPLAIENAVANLIRGQSIGPATVVRCWHNLRADQKWSTDADRVLPCIDVRCSAPKTDDNQITLSASCAIQIMTNAEDDQDHAAINAYEEAVQHALDTLYAQWRAPGQSGAVYQAFRTSIETDCSGALVGGLEFGDPLPPFDDGGINSVGVTLIVHFSRNDF